MFYLLFNRRTNGMDIPRSAMAFQTIVRIFLFSSKGNIIWTRDFYSFKFDTITITFQEKMYAILSCILKRIPLLWILCNFLNDASQCKHFGLVLKNRYVTFYCFLCFSLHNGVFRNVHFWWLSTNCFWQTPNFRPRGCWLTSLRLSAYLFIWFFLTVVQEVMQTVFVLSLIFLCKRFILS